MHGYFTGMCLEVVAGDCPCRNCPVPVTRAADLPVSPPTKDAGVSAMGFITAFDSGYSGALFTR
ncbi:hypothetical protein C4K35_1856 [Pseudomonas chlororaphis subsp. piscium]|nr:hypothetical protein C4K35_1856 [Pseudomonas chlororaphis subsp. piscium]AZC56077.1 hypothetical protein C4K34_1901 [Pseudomonas chlororaphis subsp. piscium]AZC74763.1 hypothetical protein C4K31_1849 [Pseudomonas chlororaphis subsp. piscium]AZC88154.1 hypothetical protein C4K29_1841 [Pseudomonas chlororaphis subsp. piscium]